LVDGNLTIYFETQATRQAYLDMPTNLPNLRVPTAATDDDDCGGQTCKLLDEATFARHGTDQHSEAPFLIAVICVSSMSHSWPVTRIAGSAGNDWSWL